MLLGPKQLLVSSRLSEGFLITWLNAYAFSGIIVNECTSVPGSVQLCDGIVAQMEDAEIQEFESSYSLSVGLYLQSSSLLHFVLVKEVHQFHETNELMMLILQYW